MTGTGATSAIIFGTGGFAVELFGLLRDSNVGVAGFVGPENSGDRLPGEWLGPDDTIRSLPQEAPVYVALGDPATRRRLSEWLRSLGRQPASMIHRAAWIAPTAKIGDEVIIYPHSTVHAKVALDRGVLVNSNVTIGHETHVGAFSNLNPGVALGGCLEIAEETYVGIGVRAKENLTIGRGVTIGAGATVVSDLTRPGTYVGTPAKRLTA